MISYPKIRQFKDIIREVKVRSSYSGQDEGGLPIYDGAAVAPTLTYSGTVKLHGTNASIVLAPNNEVRVQSRKRVITVNKDNHGFAKFAIEGVGEAYWLAQGTRIREQFDLSDSHTIILYGEWCGGNIQGGVALTNLERMFVIFSVKVKLDEDTSWLDLRDIKLDPAGWVKNDNSNDDTNSVIKSIYDFENYTIEIDFNNPGAARNKMV
jgi:hypothetical protein